MHTLQPDMLIFNMWDPDVRWIGNEEGIAPLRHTNVVSEVDFSVMTTEKEKLDSTKFMPAECDTKMRSAWFDCEDNEDTILTLDELVGIYYMSVGRGANLLLNIGPDKRGLLPEKDAARLREFGAELKRRFSTPIAEFGAMQMTDDGCAITSAKRVLVNHVILKEDLTHGEGVKKYEIYADGKMVYAGFAIGHKAICPFPTIRASRLYVKVVESDGDYTLSDMKAYYLK